MHHEPAYDPHLLRRVHAEYLEMPGLTLTLPQARRLWQLDEETCRQVLSRLVGSGFLTETRSGSFKRIADGTTRQEAPRSW